jgi:transcriptional regulator with PAS, ATPase and Fis domain
VGGTQAVRVDVRIIAATNRDLMKMVKEARFREDLYYRLNVVPIKIPPLRQRREDIPPLVIKVLETYNRAHASNKRLNARVVDRLKRYEFPGNVRELINVMERMIIMSENDQIGIDDIPAEIFDYSDISQTIDMEGLPLRESLKKMEIKLIQNALGQSESIALAAKRLNIHHSTLWRKMARYNILHK